MAIWRNLESRLSCSVFGGADDPQKPQPGNDCGTFGLHSSLTGRSGRDLPLSCADPQLKFLRLQQKVISIGIVVRFSAAPGTKFNCCKSSVFSTKNSIGRISVEYSS
jgi:hypothetical protein